MGVETVVGFFVCLGLMAAVMMYGVLTEGRRGRLRLDSCGHVVDGATPGEQRGWLVVDEIDGAGPGEQAQARLLLDAWLATRGLSTADLRPGDVAYEMTGDVERPGLRIMVRTRHLLTVKPARRSRPSGEQR